MGKACIIASGKGGAGKSTVSAALGQALASEGKNVCLMDCDIGLRDLDMILGMENQVVYDLMDVCCKNCGLELALLTHPIYPNLKLLPASQFARSSDLEKKQFKKVFLTLLDQFDWVILDAPAGIEHGLRILMLPQIDELLILSTPDDVCIRNAERVVQLGREKKIGSIQLIVNKLERELIASGEMYTAKVVAEVLDLPLLGEIPNDLTVSRAMLKHSPLLNFKCPAAEAITRIAKRLEGHDVPLPAIGMEKRSWLTKYLCYFRKLKEVNPS